MRLPRAVVLLGTLLAACATVPPAHDDEGPAEEVVSSFEEGCEDERSVILLCGEEECGFFQCRDFIPARVVLARGGGIIAPPAAPGGSPRRWWGSFPWMGRDARPILTFRLYASLDPKPPPLLLPPGRYVRHHIFPQARDLAEWFSRQGVDIHRFTMLIPEHIHLRIHSGPRGGAWNQAWRQFRDANRGAQPEEIYRHAGELIYRFELLGPVAPYRSRRP